MNAEYIQQSLTHCAVVVTGLVGRTWPEHMMAAAVESLTPYPETAMINAIKRAALEFTPGMLPPIQRLIDVVVDEDKKLNLSSGLAAEHHRDSLKIPRHEESRFGEGGGRHQQYAMKLIKLTLDPSVSRMRVFEGLQIMAKEFPGVGWNESVMHHARTHGDLSSEYSDDKLAAAA